MGKSEREVIVMTLFMLQTICIDILVFFAVSKENREGGF